MGKTIKAPAIGVAFALAGCGEVVHPTPPEKLDDRMVVFAVLNTDSTRHFVEVGPADGMSRWELTGVSVAIYRGTPEATGLEWTLVASGKAKANETGDRRDDPCYHKSGIVSLFRDRIDEGRRCVTPEAALEPGAVYKVEATADGRHAASGTTQAIGAFDIESAVLDGSKGKHTISASWTESAASHRYLMGMRRRDSACANCRRAWQQDLSVTRYQGPVPQAAVDSAGRSPVLDVAAVDRHLHAFVTTGHHGNHGTVQPVQNVRGGFGVVGSAVYRSRKIDLNAPGGGSGPGTS